MGLKSGSRDAGLEESDDDRPDDAGETDPAGAGQGTEASTGRPSAEGGDDRPSFDSIPYKLRRNRVNEGREQVPYFLREEVIDAEDGLKASLEERLGEEVYKSDYREASMVLAQRNPDLVAEVLREWGYDLE